MSKQTQAAAKILDNVQRSLKASCYSCPDVMLGCILDEAQELTNKNGYAWDVALAKACKIYHATKYCGNYIYS